VKRRFARANRLFVIVCLLDLALPSANNAQTSPPGPKPAPSNELDAFMAKVLEKREINRQTLEQYVLDEVEHVEVLGPSRMPVYRQKREYTWYVRDGLHVRSPVRFDGVAVGDAARKEYEDEWAKRERGRLARKAEQEKNEAKDGKAVSTDTPTAQDTAEPGPAGSAPIPTPRFVSEAYFMDFKFEPGNYYLVGREQIEAQTVLRIEYYPTRMFNDDEDRDKPRDQDRERRRARRENQREREMEQRIYRQMN
jgi:hypothetical protein